MAYPDDFARAKRAARAKNGFYIHLTTYVAVNALLIGINLATSTQALWFKWPLLGWGIGIFIHAVVTFALPRWRATNAR
jgi:uncharacterized membrane protein